MRDLVLYLHILSGLALILLPFMIISLDKKSSWLKPLSVITTSIGWILLLPAGNLYLKYYPATKTLIKAGSWPWAHSIFMETKEHWGILLPIIATVATCLVFSNKLNESKKWWRLTAILSLLIGIFGYIVTTGGKV